MPPTPLSIALDNVCAKLNNLQFQAAFFSLEASLIRMNGIS